MPYSAAFAEKLLAVQAARIAGKKAKKQLAESVGIRVLLDQKNKRDEQQLKLLQEQMRTDREKDQMEYARKTALLTKKMETASRERIAELRAGAKAGKKPSGFTLDGTRYGWTGDAEVGWSPTVIAKDEPTAQELFKADRELQNLYEMEDDINEAITKNITEGVVDELGDKSYSPVYEARMRIRLKQIKQNIAEREAEVLGKSAPEIGTPISGKPQPTGLTKPDNVLGLDLPGF